MTERATAGTDAGVWTLPNLLSAIRLAGVPVFLWLVLGPEADAWALGLLVLSGVTDWLDGWLARRLGQTSVLGQVLDPVADRLYILAVVVGLAMRDVIPWWLAVSLPLRDALMWLLVPLLRTRGYSALPVHFLGKAATFNLLYAFPLLLLGDGEGTVAELAQVFGWAFAFWGVGLYWWAGLLYAWQVRKLLRTTERRPRPARSAGTAGTAGRGTPHRTAAIVVAAFGVLATTAAVQTAQGADEAQSSRTVLVARVVERRETVEQLQDRILALRSEVEESEQLLPATPANQVTAQSRLRRLQIRTGFIAVRGEGVRITMSDAPPGGELIRDTDLQLLVNGLWQAGAEAISINGQRLTVRSAIENSGSVVNINSQPLRSPYVVNAVGDRRTLQADLLASDSGIGVADLVTRFGFGFEMVNVEELVLPAAAPRTLRHAEPLPADDGPRDPEEGTP